MRLIIVKEFTDLAPFIDLSKEKEVCIISDPIYGLQYGIRYYIAMRKELEKKIPQTQFFLGVCCDDLPGYAMEAIAAKVDRIYFRKTSPYWEKIQSLCQNATIEIYDQDELLANA